MYVCICLCVFIFLHLSILVCVSSLPVSAYVSLLFWHSVSSVHFHSITTISLSVPTVKCVTACGCPAAVRRRMPCDLQEGYVTVARAARPLGRSDGRAVGQSDGQAVGRL